MKKLITILLLTVFFWVFTSNKMIAQNPTQPNVTTDCNRCKTTSTTDHDITEKEAAKMIKKFKREFTVATYGGTIYGDEKYFNEIPNSAEKNSKMIRYHFCTDGKDSRNLFLAFEKADCIPSTQDANLFVSPDKTPGECRKSNEQCFNKINPRFVLSLKKFRKRLRDYHKPHSYVFHSKEYQKITAEDVKTGRDFLENNPYFKEHILCGLNGGNFNFESSIQDIYKQASLAGKPCAGIRFFFGYVKNCNHNINLAGDGNEIRVLIVGVDDDGNNLMVWKENSYGR